MGSVDMFHINLQDWWDFEILCPRLGLDTSSPFLSCVFWTENFCSLFDDQPGEALTSWKENLLRLLVSGYHVNVRYKIYREKKTIFIRNLLQLLFNNLTKLDLNIIQYNCVVSTGTFETISTGNIYAMYRLLCSEHWRNCIAPLNDLIWI